MISVLAKVTRAAGAVKGGRMRLLRWGEVGAERPGMLDEAGRRRDLSGVIADLTGAALAPDRLAALAALDPATLPLVPEAARIAPCVGGVGKFIGIGLNYADHAAEAGLPVPTEPVVFNKWISCLAGAEDDLTLPPGSVKTDWEVELGVVIGTPARRVSLDQALDHVAGYCVVNDISEREWQIEHGPTWDKGKGFDGFGPIGPWLVTRDAVPDPQALDLWLSVDGVMRQRGRTATMVFPVAEIVAYVSRIMTLMPGDVIATGTPPGVGMGMQPPVYLRAGQVMRAGITGLGEQRTRVL